MHNLRRFWRLISAVCTVATVLVCLQPHVAAAIPPVESERCFPETKQCISGRILEYWDHMGGLPVFGYPITALRTETVEGTWTGPVQWFERDRLEDHGAQGVMAGRLGARFLELQGRPWTQGTGPARNDNECMHFPQTGYNVCGKFRTFWERSGGTFRLGYPISDVLNETVENTTYQVQYFERRRVEYHPEHAGTFYEFLFGLLGRDILGGNIASVPAIGALTVTPERILDPNGDPAARAVYGYETVTLTVDNVQNAVRVVFFADPPGVLGRDIGATTTITGGRASIRWTVPPATGTFTVYAQASNNSGQFVTSTPVPVTVLPAGQVPATP